MGAVTENKWWGFLKHKIRDFVIKYGRQLNLDRTNIAKSLEDKLSRAMEGRDSLIVDLARRDLERDASERYKRYVVRSRLKRVPNEAVKCNALTRVEEVRKFPSRYVVSVPGRACVRVESCDTRCLSGALLRSLCSLS